MKEVLIGLAEYNRDANKKLVGILRGVDEAILKEDQGAYYKSILGTLEHIISAELFWLRKYAGFFSYKSLSGHRCITADLDAMKAAIRDKPAAVYETLAELDALFVEFVVEVAAGELHKRVSYVNHKGDTVERAYWNFVMAGLNHATHHRGEISTLLDRKGIANDVSGFNAYRS
jgi:uncharacterized damage-inducible protein DinB